MPRPSANLLRDLGRLLTRSHDLEETLNNVVRLVARWMRASACSIYLLEDDGRTLILRATRGLNPNAVGRMRIRVGQGIAGRSLEQRETIAVPDVRQDPRIHAFPYSGEQRFRSLVAVPLLVRGEPVGVLTARTARVRVFTPEQLELLEMITAQVGTIVLNARLLDRAVRDASEGRASQPAPARELRKPGMPLRGIATSPGIARGSVHLLAARLDLSNLDYRPARTAEAEWRALQRALRETVRQLNELRETVGARFGEELADVFTTHIMILEDQGFRERLRRQLDVHGNGARALVETLQSYAAILGASHDPTLRERAADMEDVLQRAVGELVGVRAHHTKLRQRGIIVAERITPSEFVLLETENVAGLVTEHGGPTSHAAIFARSLEIPAVSGVPGLLEKLRPDDELIVDGLEGAVIAAPTRAQRTHYAESAERYERLRGRLDELRGLPSETRDGVRVRLSANIGGLFDLDLVKRYGAEGVGLLRTEILALSSRGLPEEEEQLRGYLRVAEQVAPDPVTVRCFDLGGEKALPNETLYEANPQLGWRAIRILLDRPELFRTQLRAIVRANARGNVKILLPMIASLDEVEASRALLSQVCRELGAQPPPLGVMIETPAAVAVAEHLARASDFFSIGTNDLMQYVLATDRENELVAGAYDPFHPAVLAGIRQAADAARAAGLPCAVCGELGGSPVIAPLLVGMGIRELSMAPFSVLVIRQVLRRLEASALEACAAQVLRCARAADVRERLAETYGALGLLDDPDIGGAMKLLLAPRVDSRDGPR
ncbi:MAG TPA: phosphoenolpyruvate--protein phosphotransferase [Myxococcota bacterium]|nr:phosphoenolpyruvate--protein phosphotransferase [Myxococcota bacterium]